MPDYILHYKAEFIDDWMYLKYNFNERNDYKACESALTFIKENNDEDRQEIDNGEKSWQDYCIYKPLRLERISIQGYAYSIWNVRKSSPIELTELGHR